jgi:hypothetical protein
MDQNKDNDDDFIRRETRRLLSKKAKVTILLFLAAMIGIAVVLIAVFVSRSNNRTQKSQQQQSPPFTLNSTALQHPTQPPLTAKPTSLPPWHTTQRPTLTHPNTATPTTAPPQPTTAPVSIVATFQSVLLNHRVSSRQHLDQSGTPQHEALHWLVNEHFLNASSSVQSIIDRYVLTVMYYAYDGSQWYDPIGFLSFQSICNWNSFLGIGAFCTNSSSSFLHDGKFQNTKVELRFVVGALSDTF